MASSYSSKYDAFISFRGEDIRDSFLSHLLKELGRNQIDVYVDEKLHPGDEISSSLVQAIEEASVSLVIFSKDYASSKWCMEELVRIIECMERHRQIVIPVFYKVDPSDVRHLRGTFEEAFGKHQERFKENMVMVQRWRSAVQKAANLSGFHFPSKKYQNESKLIEEIAKDVSEKLGHIFSSETKGLVGIDEQIEYIESLLAVELRSELRMLGIWGMGGIGKTTIAKVVFHKYSSHFEHCCFLENVRDESQKRGLPYLFQKLVSELLQEKNILLDGLSTAQITNVKRRLSRVRVFLVLDDVNSSQQLEHLIGEQICLGPGSMVIITTRDKQILTRAHGVYEVQGLNLENSLNLFCLNAFSKTLPDKGYEKQSEMAVGYTKGVPLALKVLGSFLRSRDIKAWESALRKLKLHPNMDIFDVLKLSYDGLDDSERNIFLDIAFFFIGKDKDDVTRLLDSCGFFAAIGIDSLLRKALISISENNNIEMHSLVEQMGWEIVYQESIKDPAKRSRLRNPEDVYDVLKNNRGTDLIEGILLNLSETKDLHLHAAHTFKRMPKLRIVKFYFTWYDERSSNVYIPAELELFSDELRYLEWMRYHLKSLPPSFCAEKLVELRMPNSQVSKLWEGVQDLPNLEIIDLCRCRQLIELPDFTKASKLREIHLTYCVSLCGVHPSILCIHTLEVLRLEYCKKLKSLVGKIHFEYLHHLNVGSCYSLEEYSVTSEKIRSLDLGWTKIVVLHSSIGRLSKLERFYLRRLRIKYLPDELCLLTSLVELDLSGCKEIIELPRNIKALTRLTTLHICYCRGLRSLPELPSSITTFDATNCTSLQTAFSIKAVSSFSWTGFSFKNCRRLDEHSLYCLMEAVHDTMMRHAFRSLLLLETDLYPDGEVCYKGSNVPGWFRYQTTKASISLELDQPDLLLGFFLCCVISQDALYVEYYDQDYYIDCQCYLGDGERGTFKIDLRSVEVNSGLNSDHVFIWCDYENKLLDEIREFRASNNFTTHSQKISLEFVIRPSGAITTDDVLKGCGVSPTYVSDIHNFIRKKDVELEFDEKYKDYRQLVLSKLNQLGR